MNDDQLERLTKVEAFFEVIAKQYEKLESGVHEINVALTGNSHGYKAGLIYRVDKNTESVMELCAKNNYEREEVRKKNQTKQERVWEIAKPILVKVGDYIVGGIIFLLLIKFGATGLIDALM